MSMFTRFVTTVLLGVMGVQFLTGIVMLYGTWWAWVFDLHRIAGFLFVALIPWKAKVIYDSLARRLKEGPGQILESLLSLVLAALMLLVAALGLMWLWRLGPFVGPLGQTLIAWHWILALITLPLFIYHVVRRWPAPRLADFTARRSVLRLLGLGVAGVLGWLAGMLVARARESLAEPRRATTGSRGFGFFTGNDFPITGERVQEIDVSRWQLRVDGAVAQPLTLAYDDLMTMPPEEVDAAVDCTSGWYSLQTWHGVPLPLLLAAAGASNAATGVRLFSVTGYNHTYPLAEARTILLATHVTGEVLEPRHGYPVRAVVPGRRGWFWVKWLVRIEVLDGPLDVPGGVVAAPRQVLRQL